MFCVLCEREYVYWPTYAIACLIAIICFFFVGYILSMSCAKFIKDQA